ncbi:hypothetical protein DPMN_161600 [Dreissena polymorpha]|uniref:Uncharacterized protein n=1 Tax=Dreissena polymorpha TaxID=45954 RepID=A0A9D4ENS1_DREPO|nr:hypothetical protein DPMN_161600 [Dreissena polymorpha]
MALAGMGRKLVLILSVSSDSNLALASIDRKLHLWICHQSGASTYGSDSNLALARISRTIFLCLVTPIWRKHLWVQSGAYIFGSGIDLALAPLYRSLSSDTNLARALKGLTYIRRLHSSETNQALARVGR